MVLDFDRYLTEYNTLSRQDLEKFRDFASLPFFDEGRFERRVEEVHECRLSEKTFGRAALKPGPLLQLISATIQPNVNPLGIYGSLEFVFYHDDGRHRPDTLSVLHYDRHPNDIQIFNTPASLSLIGPTPSIYPYKAYLPLFDLKLNVNLFDNDNNGFVNSTLSLKDVDMEDEHEKVTSVLIPGNQGSLLLKYIAIPMGVFCLVRFQFSSRRRGSRKNFNVNGKIAALYGHTYGNYSSEEIPLFDKTSTEFEPVEMDHELHLSRCWVSVPAYSSLILHIDLSEFETGQKIVNDTLEFLPLEGWGSSDGLVLDDMILHASILWYSPRTRGPYDDEEHTEMEYMDIDRDEEPSPLPSSSNLGIPPILKPHREKLWPSPGLEIFSVVIGLENFESAQIYGSIKYFEKYAESGSEVYIFKRGEDEAFNISKHLKSMPILYGSRQYDDEGAFVMEFDIKDVEGRFAVKGYNNWDGESVDADKQICSLIPGKNGFAALHYSFFPEAVQASIHVSMELKMGPVADLYTKVHGSFVAEYSSFIYESRYNKDYYRMVLFSSTQDDSIPLYGDVPLSRSTLIVPRYSSLIIQADLSLEGHMLSESADIMIGQGFKNIETIYGNICIRINWSNIK